MSKDQGLPKPHDTRRHLNEIAKLGNARSTLREFRKITNQYLPESQFPQGKPSATAPPDPSEDAWQEQRQQLHWLLAIRTEVVRYVDMLQPPVGLTDRKRAPRAAIFAQAGQRIAAAIDEVHDLNQQYEALVRQHEVDGKAETGSRLQSTAAALADALAGDRKDGSSVKQCHSDYLLLWKAWASAIAQEHPDIERNMERVRTGQLQDLTYHSLREYLLFHAQVNIQAERQRRSTAEGKSTAGGGWESADPVDHPEPSDTSEKFQDFLYQSAEDLFHTRDRQYTTELKDRLAHPSVHSILERQPEQSEFQAPIEQLAARGIPAEIKTGSSILDVPSMSARASTLVDASPSAGLGDSNGISTADAGDSKRASGEGKAETSSGKAIRDQAGQQVQDAIASASAAPSHTGPVQLRPTEEVKEIVSKLTDLAVQKLIAKSIAQHKEECAKLKQSRGDVEQKLTVAKLKLQMAQMAVDEIQKAELVAIRNAEVQLGNNTEMALQMETERLGSPWLKRLALPGLGLVLQVLFGVGQPVLLGSFALFSVGAAFIPTPQAQLTKVVEKITVYAGQYVDDMKAGKPVTWVWSLFTSTHWIRELFVNVSSLIDNISRSFMQLVLWDLLFLLGHTALDYLGVVVAARQEKLAKAAEEKLRASEEELKRKSELAGFRYVPLDERAAAAKAAADAERAKEGRAWDIIKFGWARRGVKRILRRSRQMIYTRPDDPAEEIRLAGVWQQRMIRLLHVALDVGGLSFTWWRSGFSDKNIPVVGYNEAMGTAAEQVAGVTTLNIVTSSALARPVSSLQHAAYLATGQSPSFETLQKLTTFAGSVPAPGGYGPDLGLYVTADRVFSAKFRLGRGISDVGYFKEMQGRMGAPLSALALLGQKLTGLSLFGSSPSQHHTPEEALQRFMQLPEAQEFLRDPKQGYAKYSPVEWLLYLAIMRSPPGSAILPDYLRTDLQGIPIDTYGGRVMAATPFALWDLMRTYTNLLWPTDPTTVAGSRRLPMMHGAMVGMGTLAGPILGWVLTKTLSFHPLVKRFIGSGAGVVSTIVRIISMGMMTQYMGRVGVRDTWSVPIRSVALTDASTGSLFDPKFALSKELLGIGTFAPAHEIDFHTLLQALTGRFLLLGQILFLPRVGSLIGSMFGAFSDKDRKQLASDIKKYEDTGGRGLVADVWEFARGSWWCGRAAVSAGVARAKLLLQVRRSQQKTQRAAALQVPEEAVAELEAQIQAIEDCQQWELKIANVTVQEDSKRSVKIKMEHLVDAKRIVQELFQGTEEITDLADSKAMSRVKYRDAQAQKLFDEAIEPVARAVHQLAEITASAGSDAAAVQQTREQMQKLIRLHERLRPREDDKEALREWRLIDGYIQRSLTAASDDSVWKPPTPTPETKEDAASIVSAMASGELTAEALAELPEIDLVAQKENVQSDLDALNKLFRQA